MPIDQQLRKKSLGASEFGSVFGVDPFRDAHALWQQKKGGISPEPAPWMKAGLKWQKPILQVYQEDTGREVEWFDETVQHPDHRWLVASPDALIRNESTVVDAKLVQWHQKHNWGTVSSQIPEQNILQQHIQMPVLGYRKGIVVAWAGETELRIYEFERDEVFEAALIEKGHKFWSRYIDGDEEPPITGSEESRKWLREQFPKNFGNVRDATRDELALLEEYEDIRIKEKLEVAELLKKKDLLENQICQLIGKDDGLRWFAGRFTWKQIKDSQKTDWEDLARTLMNAHLPVDEIQSSIDYFTETVPGYRRIDFRSDRLREATRLQKEVLRGIQG